MSDQQVSTDASTLKDRKKRYKKSLNLPKTSFPMRANLAQNEPQSLKRWAEQKIYSKLLEARAEAANFAFHDGPPYANGSIHAGHLLNKVLKDMVVRSRNMAGLRCHFVPGWDCHGLPIEHKVMAGLIESGKSAKLDTLEPAIRHMAIRRECASYAKKFQKLQRGQMERLLTLADYEKPYLTLQPSYERAEIELFADLVEQGLVYRALKPVHWSIANHTALAEAELEYMDRVDPSIYVDFEAADPSAVATAFGVDPSFGVEQGRAKPSFMIWTTTPWTLPSNLLIAVHEKFTYALVRFSEEGRLTVVARELLAKVAEVGGRGSYEVLGETSGKELIGLEYLHPFCDRKGRLVEADYVTLEDGTGLVHTAPGHGQEDYQTGQREGLPVYCPVQDDGTYDDSVPDWIRGQSIWDANPKIIEHTRASGHLYHSFEFNHSYPHDWRSKTPVIFRCTEQWFIAVDEPTRHDAKSLRDLAFRAVDEEVRFIPGWGASRLRGMLESRPDWCISRQRSWGLPIPSFKRPDGSVFITAASARAVAEVFAREGSDAWFTKNPEELLADYDPASDPQAPEGLATSQLERMFDIFDVWFESGSSWYAVMQERDLGFPVDLYLEGSDQHRGWFQSSMLVGLGSTGHAPYKALLTHGFTVDKNGKKMSKSDGNALQVEDLVKDYGAEVCRWWVSSLAFEGDMKVDLSYFDVAGDSYRKVRNTLRFLLSNLSDFTPGMVVDLETLEPTSIDVYTLAQAAELRTQAMAAYENYQFRQAHLLLFNFCNETLSSFYLDAVKDRLYCDRADSPRRRACQTVMREIANLLVHLLAPILPHTADEAYLSLHGDRALQGDAAESVHLASVHLAVVPEVRVPEVDTGWARVLEAREASSKALEEAKDQGIENRLDAGVVLGDDDGTLARFHLDLADVIGVSRVELTTGAGVSVQDLRQEPRCERSWKRDGTVKERADGGWLTDRDADAAGAV